MATRAEPLRKPADYYTIKDGSFRLPSTEENKDAIRREYINPKTNQPGVAFELGFNALYGFIENVKFVENILKDGTTLRSLNIVLGANEDGKSQIISVPIDSRYSADFLKRLPNVDVAREVQLRPYDYQDKSARRHIGFGVQHANDKGEWLERVEDFFTEVKEVGGTKVFSALNGFPEATEKDARNWKLYFMKVTEFLIDYTTEHVLTKFSDDEKKNRAMDQALSPSTSEASSPDIEYPKEEVNPDDIPF